MRSGKRVGGRGGRAPRRLVLAGDRGRRVPLARSQRARKTSPPPSLTTVRARARTWRSRSRLGPTFGWLRDLPPPASPALAAITQFPKLAKSIENEPPPRPPPKIKRLVKNGEACSRRQHGFCTCAGETSGHPGFHDVSRETFENRDQKNWGVSVSESGPFSLPALNASKEG